MTDTPTSHVVILDDGPTDILHLHCERTGETREIDVLEWARETENEDIVKALEARKA